MVSNAKGMVLPERSPSPVRIARGSKQGAQSLREQQAWLQQVVTCTPERLENAMAQTSDFIKEGYGLDPESRLWIYRSMFPIRMVESLQIDFPGVAYTLGPEAFEELVMSYVEEHPSSSWTLNHLGMHFPAFLARSSLRGRTFLQQLATLELNLAQVFDEPELPALQAEDLQSLPPAAWDELILRPRPTSRLLKFDYPVWHYLFQVDGELSPSKPARSPQRVLIMRKGFQMNRVVLPESSFFMLKDLFAGKKLSQAIERVVRKYPTVGAPELQSWFHSWGEWGIFQA